MANMDKIQTFAVFIAFLLLIPEIQSQSYSGPTYEPPPPLCITQFSLVNHACAFLPFTPLLLPSPPSPPDDDDDDDDDDHAHDNSLDNHGHNHDNDGGHHPNPNHQHHHHIHRHGHGHGHGHGSMAAEEDCCRWLKEVDSKCVCSMLVRLPAFLVRPTHRYTVVVEDECKVTFECEGQFRA